jgi:hypothetical protein
MFQLPVLLLLLISGAAGLDIDGPLAVNSLVTWSAADSPVYVKGTIDIENGGVLTILQGVQVIFRDSSSGIINSAGTLLILGESNNRVWLEPEGDHSWQGVSFGAQAISAFFAEEDGDFTFSSGSVIQYSDIKFAGSSSTPALDFRSGAAPFLLGVDLVECVGPSGYSLYVEELQGFFVSKFLRLVKNATDSSFNPSNAFYVKGSSIANGIVVLENIETTPVATRAL